MAMSNTIQKLKVRMRHQNPNPKMAEVDDAVREFRHLRRVAAWKRVPEASAFAFVVFLIGGPISVLLYVEIFAPDLQLFCGLAGAAIAAGLLRHSRF